MKGLLRSSLFLLILTFLAIDISAQNKISVQGVIRKSDGNAVDDGDYEVTFKLYDALTNGNLLWEETQTDLNVTSGIYSTILGEVTPLDVPFDTSYFLSLTIEGEELVPRAPLTSAPYSSAMLGSDNVFPSNGDVGIGTLTPEEKVDVDGNLKVDSIFASGDLYVNNIHIPYTGSINMYGIQSGVNYYTVTIPPVPESYLGVHSSVILVYCSYGAAGATASVVRARLVNTTTLGLDIQRITGSASTSYYFNYIIFPIN